MTEIEKEALKKFHEWLARNPALDDTLTTPPH